MNKLLILFLLLPSIPCFSDDIKIVRVIDGDTVVISAPFLPKPLKPTIPLRIGGVDTPEKGKRAHCKSEAELGEAATTFTKDLVSQAKTVDIIIKGEDKYFRLLGDVLLDGKSLKDSLLEKGFAHVYHGEKKQSWCEQ